MALTAFSRLRMLWGALDWQAGSDNPYSSAETVSGGSSAAAGAGIGVRRVVFTIDRATSHPGADAAEFHFDFLNMTGSAPDDTWITSDYTTLEGYLDTWFTAIKVFMPTGYKLTQYSWYRHGPGVGKPNPAERVLLKGTPVAGSASGHGLPPQAACTLTFRTAVRRSWGRTYLPLVCATPGSSGVLAAADVNSIASATNTLITSAAGADFFVVVVSDRLSAALNIEHLEVDDNIDIIRRRRWKQSTYKKLYP